MAKFGCWKNGWIEVNGVVLSDHTQEINIEQSAAELPNDAMGDEVAIMTSGLFDWTITATFYQDFAAGSVDATLNPLYLNRSFFPVRIRPDSAATSPTNPMYSGTAVLVNYPPISGRHGQNLMTKAVFRPAIGTQALARQTS